MNRTPVTDCRQPTDLLRGSGAEEPADSGPTATVPRELVHRARADDVLLTGWKSLGDERFSVTANWPYTHEFYNPVHGRHDPVLIVETLRQAAILLCHAEFAVPLEHHFLMGDLHYTSHPKHLEVAGPPAELTLDVVCSDIRRRGDRLSATNFRMTVRNGAHTVATGGGHLTISTPQAYRRLRGASFPRESAAPTIPVLPQLVGRTDLAHVVLAPTPAPGRWQLRADDRNATLFGRAVDHYPGMILVEAAHQAATALLSPAPFYPASFTIDFHRYVEFAPPCWIEAHTVPTMVSGATSVRVTGHQDGQPVFTASLTDAGQ
ncbi:ScbA/BarX family gamma-butyrolactone biosynthesis protein [Streptomyces sp. NPDC019531]|uniref:ScbA/BarX family gamma-butyrolactone biosynthesis protein n=1 Tax=Streptomyces sp. NPDC019531 TaxID=3365062 RepID=UPI0038514742